MPSIKYPRIEITQEAYLALEAEAILQGKTLKKLASEIILKEMSQKALNFVQESSYILEASMRGSETLDKAIKDIGSTRISIDATILDNIVKNLLDGGYQGAMLYVAQHTASVQRDELFRVLTVCQLNKVPSSLAADIIRNFNLIHAEG